MRPRMAARVCTVVCLLVMAGCGLMPEVADLEEKTGLEFPEDTRLVATKVQTSGQEHKQWAKLQFATSQRDEFLKSVPGEPISYDDERPTVITSPPLFEDWWHPLAGKDYAELVYEHDRTVVSMLVTLEATEQTTVYLLVASSKKQSD